MTRSEIQEAVAACRRKWPILSAKATPIDMLTFVELELHLDIIPAHGIKDAALTPDFSGIFVNWDVYNDLNTCKPWLRRRFRFTLAHEFAHWYLHQTLVPERSFARIRDMLLCLRDRKAQTERDADEFAGQLLVPTELLWEKYKAMHFSHDQLSPDNRHKFCEYLEGYFGVNDEVISIQLHSEGIWLGH